MSTSSSGKDGPSHPTEVGGIPVYVVAKKGEPPTLRLIKGPGAPKAFPLASLDVVIGRDAEADIVVESASISRKHARLQRAEGAVSCEDLGSSNGVFVNGTRRESVKLENGDTIQIGDALFVFQAGG